MLYDTHSHPYLAKNLSETDILESFFKSEWKYINSIWCDIPSSQKSIELAKQYEWVFASIWIHPTHCMEYMNEDLPNIIHKLEKLYYKNSQYITAIGEIWLDYYWLESLWEKYNISENELIQLQKTYFIAQIQLSQKLGLPIIIHNRSSSEDVFEILREYNCKNFVFHCFNEDINYAQKLIDFAPNCMLWFGWVVTFKNAQITQQVVENIPLKHILIETDSPYLTPAPFRGKRENEPILVKEVLSKIIDLRIESSETIMQKIFQNSIDFFAIKNNQI